MSANQTDVTNASQVQAAIDAKLAGTPSPQTPAATPAPGTTPAGDKGIQAVQSPGGAATTVAQKGPAPGSERWDEVYGEREKFKRTVESYERYGLTTPDAVEAAVRDATAFQRMDAMLQTNPQQFWAIVKDTYPAAFAALQGQGGTPSPQTQIQTQTSGAAALPSNVMLSPEEQRLAALQAEVDALKNQLGEVNKVTQATIQEKQFAQQAAILQDRETAFHGTINEMCTIVGIPEEDKFTREALDSLVEKEITKNYPEIAQAIIQRRDYSQVSRVFAKVAAERLKPAVQGKTIPAQGTGAVQTAVNTAAQTTTLPVPNEPAQGNFQVFDPDKQYEVLEKATQAYVKQVQSQ